MEDPNFLQPILNSLSSSEENFHLLAIAFDLDPAIEELLHPPFMTFN
jgi:hypothetical protein